jgi:putative Mn2+ efflux pump MntP
MVFVEIVFIAIGLSADAFSVSIGNGMSMPGVGARKALAIAFAFGGFQAAMPFAGYFLGRTFISYIAAYDHIVALVLLGFIGGRMVIEGVRSQKNSAAVREVRTLTAPMLLLQAVATSIDALIVGIGFATMGLPVPEMAGAAALIGIITFALCFAGVQAGRKLGALLGARAEIVGGAILIAIGIKTFIEDGLLR